MTATDPAIRDGLALLRTLHKADAIMERLGCREPDGRFVIWLTEAESILLEVVAVRLSGASAHARADGLRLDPIALPDGSMIQRFRLGGRFEAHYLAAGDEEPENGPCAETS